jgi:multicomponent Na+:H+ antiporter subunit E
MVALERMVALAAWAFGVWVLLTWTRSVEQLAFGAGVALAVGFALAPLGRVVGPWRLLRPHRLFLGVCLLVVVAGRMVSANVRLAVRIWSPSRPLASGMVVVPTRARSAGAVTTVGLLSSLIVDNQLVDLDHTRHRLQYHALIVPAGTPQQRRDRINGPLERWLPGQEDADG